MRQEVSRDRSDEEELPALETLGRPVVALLAGAALGGGWEVALAAPCTLRAR